MRQLCGLTLALSLTPFVASAQSVPAVAPAAAPKKLSEPEKIEALISGVEKSAGIRFIRNGAAYDGAAAGKHLRGKLRHAGSRIHTAREFIDELASKSSMSRNPYRIRFADGHEENSADYFNRKLAEMEKGK